MWQPDGTKRQALEIHPVPESAKNSTDGVFVELKEHQQFFGAVALKTEKIIFCHTPKARTNMQP